MSDSIEPLSHSASEPLIITLLSDLGTSDASVTVAKATLMRYAPRTVIIDISHHVAQYNLQQAAYLLFSAYRHFAKGTVHVCMVNVFTGDKPRMLLAEKDGYYFITPDNGVLPLAFGAGIESVRLCFEYAAPLIFSNWVNDAGRVIELLQIGNELPFSSYTIKKTPRLLQPKPMNDGIECNILYIDRYENVVLDITREHFNEIVKERPFRIKIMRMDDITAISNSYSDVAYGQPLCRFNNAGFLEIAVNNDRAASLLGLESFSTANLRYHTVKIFFQASI